MLPNVWSNAVKMNVLISRHRDGVLISRTLEHLGIGTISGSTSKGGAGALAAMVRVLRRGEFVSITPDGPRGPRMWVAPGAIAAAKLSGAYLLPVSFSARWRIVGGSSVACCLANRIHSCAVRRLHSNSLISACWASLYT